MFLKYSRYLAVIFAIGLGIGETVMNWGHWQYAPLWIVDYVVAAWLVLGFCKTRSGQNIHILLSAWAFTTGVFYMALFVSLDPGLKIYINAEPIVLILMVIMLVISAIGYLTAIRAIKL
jgi:hypothetical protein